VIFTAPSFCPDCDSDVLLVEEACGMGMHCRRYRKRLQYLFQIVEKASTEPTPWGEALREALELFVKAGDR
jgi:hypothetical protein